MRLNILWDTNHNAKDQIPYGIKSHANVSAFYEAQPRFGIFYIVLESAQQNNMFLSLGDSINTIAGPDTEVLPYESKAPRLLKAIKMEQDISP